MEIKDAKKLIKEYLPGHSAFVLQADIGERYYRNENDILFRRKKDEKEPDERKNPLRNADNRISHNFHGMLVNQKAAYMFTYPPLFDVGAEANNKLISRTLGTKFRKVCKKLCINASNTGIAWLHYWEKDGKLQYSVIDSRQIVPVWTDDQERELQAVLRTYNRILDDGKGYIVYEIWTQTCCESFAQEIGSNTDLLLFYSMLEHCIIDIEREDANKYKHEWGRVPFIPFMNNDMETSDLKNIKGLIDAYDKVYSGFVDDLEDIQEIIFVLCGYGGTELDEFLKDLKKYKTVSLDDDGEGAGLSTLTIDIPVEAREKMLAMTRKEIFEQGQGVDPQPGNYGNASGEALKFMYTLLELKSGLMEIEFQISLEEFVQVICQHQGIACDDVQQTWTRNMIRNDKELAEICRDGVGIISQKTIVKNHPLVEDPAEELKQIEQEEERKRQQEENMMYGDAFKGQQDNMDNDSGHTDGDD